MSNPGPTPPPAPNYGYGASQPPPPEPPKKKPFYKRPLGIALIVLAIIIVVSIATSSGGGGDSDKAADDKATAAGSPKDTKTSAKPKPEPAALKVAAGKILSDFEDNEATADAKYKGKVLQVTGHVSKVDTELFDDDQYVVQLDNGDEFAVWSVNCNDIPASVATKVKKDSTITVRGDFDDGGDLGVEIKDCKVLGQ